MLLILKFIYFIIFKKKIGSFRVKRITNKIVMGISIRSIAKYYRSKHRLKLFLYECDALLKSLDKNVIYKANTHSLIIKKLKNKPNIRIISCNDSKVKSLFIEKLLIGNTKKLFKKQQFYNVKFVIEEKGA